MPRLSYIFIEKVKKQSSIFKIALELNQRDASEGSNGCLGFQLY